VALLQTPHRFRTKRQLWAYSGFAVETHDSGEYRWVRGKLQRNRERITVRGLNDNHNKDVKNLFKSAAISASTRPGPLHDFYVARVDKGMLRTSSVPCPSPLVTIKAQQPDVEQHFFWNAPARP
jgi:transposase